METSLLSFVTSLPTVVSNLRGFSKPMRVLKADGLPHVTPDDWRDADAVQALYKATEPFMPEMVASDTDSVTTDTSCDSQTPSVSHDSS